MANLPPLSTEVLADTRKYNQALQGAAANTTKFVNHGKRSFTELERQGIGLKGAKNEFAALGTKGPGVFQRITTAIRGSTVAMTALGGAIGLATGAVIKFGIESVKAFAKLEQQQIAFRTLFGRAGGGELMNQLRELSTRTPQTQEDFLNAAKALSTFGVETQRIVPLLRRFSDLASLSGSRLSDVADIYGKAFAGGTLQLEEINRLTDRQIGVLQVMAKQRRQSVREFRKDVSAGIVTVKDLDKAIVEMTSRGGKFFDMANKQADTLIGKFSTLTGNVQNTMAAFGQTAAESTGLGFWMDLVNIGLRSINQPRNVPDYRQFQKSLRRQGPPGPPPVPQFGPVNPKTVKMMERGAKEFGRLAGMHLGRALWRVHRHTRTTVGAIAGAARAGRDTRPFEAVARGRLIGADIHTQQGFQALMKPREEAMQKALNKQLEALNGTKDEVFKLRADVNRFVTELIARLPTFKDFRR